MGERRKKQDVPSPPRHPGEMNGCPVPRTGLNGPIHGISGREVAVGLHQTPAFAGVTI
jgi:hypothetical protein